MDDPSKSNTPPRPRDEATRTEDALVEAFRPRVQRLLALCRGKRRALLLTTSNRPILMLGGKLEQSTTVIILGLTVLGWALLFLTLWFVAIRRLVRRLPPVASTGPRTTTGRAASS